MPPSSEWLAHDIERYALNALLVPLLEDADDRPHWREREIAVPCAGNGDVLVDGRPLEPGAELTGRSLRLQWTLDDCFPLGVDGPALSGRAELDVFFTDDEVTATVRFDALRASRDGVDVTLDRRFTARMP